MGETLLLELLPLPAPSIMAGPFLYSELFPGGRKEYETSILPRRIKTLRYLVETYRPRFVICYGRTNWQRYRELFDLHDEPEQLIAPRSRAVVGRYGETVVALTPFFDDPYFPHTAIKAVGERIIAAQQEIGRRGQGVN